MNVPEFRPIFEAAWKGYPEEVKKFAWDNCFRRTKSRKNGILSGRAVTIYRILARTKGPYLAQS